MSHQKIGQIAIRIEDRLVTRDPHSGDPNGNLEMHKHGLIPGINLGSTVFSVQRNQYKKAVQLA